VAVDARRPSVQARVAAVEVRLKFALENRMQATVCLHPNAPLMHHSLAVC
jgi:hypothetical protein